MIITCDGRCGRPLRRAPVYAQGAMWYCPACARDIPAALRSVEQSEIDNARVGHGLPVAEPPHASGKTRVNLRNRMREMGMPMAGIAAEIARSKRRKTHCCMGHPFSEENTRIDIRGARVCRKCAATKAHDAWIRRKKKKLDELPAAETA